MISLDLARQLKTAGVSWQPKLHDLFMIPDSDLDEHIFVLSDLMAQVEVLRGWPAITFVGAVEWALDFVYTKDVVWLPSEEQLRELLRQTLPASAELALFTLAGGVECRVVSGDATLRYPAGDGATAYAHALLDALG